jgi:hypothetical protein
MAPAAGEMATLGRTEAQAAGGQTAALPPPGMARKIIYDAQIDLVIKDIDPIATRLARLVQDHQGYIAEQNLAGSPGTQRSGHWKVRVPVERFEDFVQAVAALGELERNQRTSQDVTEQYYDHEARIKNKKVEERTLTKILEERGGKLEDVLKVEVELSRVRGEIEQLEGHLRVLDNLSSLATVTINLRERERYEPPSPVAPDFATQISRAWHDSLQALTNLGKATVLALVAWALWIPLLILGLAVAWLLLKLVIRRLVRVVPRLWALARTPITPPRSP